MPSKESWKYDAIMQEELDKAFKAPEPLVKPSIAPRVLVIGTKAELRELRPWLGFYRDNRAIGYCSEIDDFLESFFGTTDLSNEMSYSLPEKIISTQFMRSHVYLAETVYVGDRLKSLADTFGLEVEVITSSRDKIVSSTVKIA